MPAKLTVTAEKADSSIDADKPALVTGDVKAHINGTLELNANNGTVKAGKLSTDDGAQAAATINVTSKFAKVESVTANVNGTINVTTTDGATVTGQVYGHGTNNGGGGHVNVKATGDGADVSVGSAKADSTSEVTISSAHKNATVAGALISNDTGIVNVQADNGTATVVGPISGLGTATDKRSTINVTGLDATARHNDQGDISIKWTNLKIEGSNNDETAKLESNITANASNVTVKAENGTASAANITASGKDGASKVEVTGVKAKANDLTSTNGANVTVESTGEDKSTTVNTATVNTKGLIKVIGKKGATVNNEASSQTGGSVTVDGGAGEAKANSASATGFGLTVSGGIPTSSPSKTTITGATVTAMAMLRGQQTASLAQAPSLLRLMKDITSLITQVLTTTHASAA